MRKFLGAFGLVAACAACCAIPFAIPALAGLTLSGAGLAAVGKQDLACVLFLAALGIGAMIIIRNRSKNKSFKDVGAKAGCGCETSCDVSGSDSSKCGPIKSNA